MMPYVFILYYSLFAFNPPEFEQQTIDDEVEIGYGLAIGDVDGDGKPDIILADKKQFVWYRNGDWQRFVIAENLTASDNVCITARDITGDGKVEIAVGAQWNPSEVSDPEKSGSVHYLIRPDDPTEEWSPVQLHHEPTVHRMRWVKAEENKYHLVVLPLHGRGNKNGEGAGVKVIAYEMPEDPTKEWKHWTIDESMHLTHNFDVVEDGKGEKLYIGGKEGVKVLSYNNGEWAAPSSGEWVVQDHSFGEVRIGESQDNQILAGIEPMHGNQLTVYNIANNPSNTTNPVRTVLTSDLNQGHALGVADFMGLGRDQVVVGWRNPNQENKVGVKLYIPQNAENTVWKDIWIDDNGMACEDLQLADLNGDGKLDIIAAGRATHNLKVYWNKSGR
ncbi:MAG: VCBS repeat-containing protein [Anditalea sp.]